MRKAIPFVVIPTLVWGTNWPLFNVAAMSAVMVPVVAMVSGAIIHREPLGLVQWVSMLCCAVGLGLALFKPAAARARS
ncbi:hypothetical protein [Piscinibacter sp.]|uniref:hypothetical protein n=1 Tax=Piscinibacter sp. TaxID=1903157 RepID=UPI002C2D27C3|nr:hypothetical protein [Albitalea sp.]HUG24206.1 hypothetical protein [Albitalea sp.]